MYNMYVYINLLQCNEFFLDTIILPLFLLPWFPLRLCLFTVFHTSQLLRYLPSIIHTVYIMHTIVSCICMYIFGAIETQYVAGTTYIISPALSDAFCTYVCILYTCMAIESTVVIIKLKQIYYNVIVCVYHIHY